LRLLRLPAADLSGSLLIPFVLFVFFVVN
jgi:hypothetical protein